MKFLFIILFSSSLFAIEGKINYERRLEMVQELGTKYPGYIRTISGDLKYLGLWSGIYLQTAWQKKSGRSHLKTWDAINTWLTVVPYFIARYENCNTNPFINNNARINEVDAPISIYEVCKSWKAYFNSAKRPLNRLSDILNTKQYELKKLLWKAHGASIAYSLWRNYSKIKNNNSEEWYFWANWTYFVYYLEKVNFSTYTRVISPIKKNIYATLLPIRFFTML
jgi:hypothetical protein